MKKELRFPSIIGLLLLIAAIAAGVYVTGRRTIFGSKASGGCTPDNVQVTNITDRSANISFITSAACLATLEINSEILTDLKSQFLNTPDAALRTHYFEAKHLKAQNTYSFAAISGGTTFNQEEYRFTTGSAPSSATPTSNLAWGRVLKADGKTPANAVIFVNIPGSQPLSSIVTTDGNWSVSLATSFNEAKTNWFTPPTSPVAEDIVVIAEDGSTVSVSNTTARNNPVPDIILGQSSIDFTSLEAPPSDTGNLGDQNQVTDSQKVDILNPRDGDVITVSQPDFFGSAPNNSTVVIEVHSDQPINGQTSADATGSWHWSPPQGLSPGEHTITVKVQSPATGLWETVSRTFTVLAADNSTGPQFEASGSGNLTPSPSPTVAPTSVPTAIPSPSLIPTAVPTDRTAHPSTTVKPPVTGESAPTIIILVFAALFVLISIKII